jgi:hypothetical protein
MPFLLLFLITFFSAPCFSQALNESPDQVWEVGDRRWTVEEELRFENWMEKTITEDFFIRHQIPTDCADAVYAIRWIYARIAHLPAAATTTDGKFVGHWSEDWKHLPTHPDWDRDERFRAALLSLFPRTWTGTLPRDTYPVRISPDSVRPGTLFLVTESHTGIVGRVLRDGSQVHPLQTWESALPVKVQKLNLRYFFAGKPEFKAGSGLVKFRWPVSENGGWRYLPANEHPFYSEEQYRSDFCKGYPDFVEAVARRIDPTTDTPLEKMTKIIGTSTRLLRERSPIVIEGYQQCDHGGCPEASEGWEMYSTPGRDGMIASLMDHLSQIIESKRVNPEAAKGMMEAIPIPISENQSITLLQVFQNYRWFSPHPGDSIEARWGLTKCEMIRTNIRSANDSIAFINRMYRKRDPKYADFSIRQQQLLLRRLNEDWSGAGCGRPTMTPEKKVQLSSPSGSSIGARRDLRKCETIRAEIRSANDSIAFIEKTYRKKDPDYADFSTRQEQHLLQKLKEEWRGSGCR